MAQIRATTRPSTAKRRRPWLCWTCLVILVIVWLIPEEEEPTALSSLPTTTIGVRDEDPVDPELVLDYPEKYLYPRKCPQTEHATLASIQQCYPEASLHLNANCTRHDTTSQQPLSWSFVQDCISGRRTTSTTTINQIHVIGERNSGTKWLQQELAQCFSSTGIRCHRDFLRSKHFFQPPARGSMQHSLVIAIVRSPEEWVAAMREKPYHMPFHIQGFDNNVQQQSKLIPLEWKEFMERSLWTMPQQSTLDKDIIQMGHQNSVSCVQGFSFSEVSPCLFNDTHILPRSKWRGHMPIYELQRDQSGRPFDDILKLRADKILNFVLEVPLVMQLGGFIAVRYEDLVREGTRPFLERIARLLGMTEGLPSTCKPQPPRPERLGRRMVPPDVQQWIEERLVLETEQMLGYR